MSGMSGGIEAGALAPCSAGPPLAPTLAAVLVRRLGGRFSTELGIDVDAGDAAVERWFLAATLFGTRIATTVAERTFHVLCDSGIRRITDAAERDREELVALLDAGGYARYDVRTATRLHVLARQVGERYGGAVAELGRRFCEPRDLAAALGELTGWGPVTTGLFLRELRGVWQGAPRSLDRRAARAGRHLGLLGEQGDEGDEGDAGGDLARLVLVARLSGCDARDLEGALVRLAMAHPKAGSCPGGRDCLVLARWAPTLSDAVRAVPLPGQRVLTIRPMTPDDGPGLVGLYAGLGEDDVYRRFFSGCRPPDSFVMQLAADTPRNGAGLVATLGQAPGTGGTATPGGGARSQPERIVAEATYTRLANGDAEFGITVARDARGWLGPYLFDALLEDAAARGIPNVRADVLMVNAQMLAMLRHRGYAVAGFDYQPAVLRVTVGTVGRVPSWPVNHSRRRVLVEVPGGRWQPADAVGHAGFEVIGCPSPPGNWEACPAWRGEPCPLAAGADVIVTAVPGDAGRSLLDGHRRLHPAVPLCAQTGPDDPDPGRVAERIARGTGGPAVEQMLRRALGGRASRP